MLNLKIETTATAEEISFASMFRALGDIRVTETRKLEERRSVGKLPSHSRRARPRAPWRSDARARKAPPGGRCPHAVNSEDAEAPRGVVTASRAGCLTRSFTGGDTDPSRGPPAPCAKSRFLSWEDGLILNGEKPVQPQSVPTPGHRIRCFKHVTSYWIKGPGRQHCQLSWSLWLMSKMKSLFQPGFVAVHTVRDCGWAGEGPVSQPQPFLGHRGSVSTSQTWGDEGE